MTAGRSYQSRPNACKEGEDRRETGLWETGFTRSSHISYKRKAGLTDRNGAVAPGVREGAGSCLRRCSRGHRPDQACSVLTQPLPAEGMRQRKPGMERCLLSSCVGSTRSWELDLQQGSFMKKHNGKKHDAPRRAGTSRAPEVTCPKRRAVLACPGDAGVLPTALPESTQLLSGGRVAHPCP